jgi:hypothetical protein
LKLILLGNRTRQNPSKCSKMRQNTAKYGNLWLTYIAQYCRNLTYFAGI